MCRLIVIILRISVGIYAEQKILHHTYYYGDEVPPIGRDVIGTIMIRRCTLANTSYWGSALIKEGVGMRVVECDSTNINFTFICRLNDE